MRLIFTISLLLSLLQSQGQFIVNGWRYGSAPVSDPDSIAYVTKVANNGGSLTSGEKAWAGNLIRNAKNHGWWYYSYAIHPALGGTEASAKVNMRDTGNYELTFYNSPTITGAGIDWNGSNQYADTHFTTDLFLTDSATIAYYSIENTIHAGIPMGGEDMDIELYSGDWYSFNLSNGGNYAFATPSSIAGLFVNTRLSTANFKIYRNATLLDTQIATAVPGVGYKIYLGARAGGGNTPAFFSTIGCGFAAILKGMDATAEANFNSDVQTFITSAGR